jgi:hypothetical protein
MSELISVVIPTHKQLTSCCDYGFMQALAGRRDIGGVDRNLFYYNWRDESLYRTASGLTRHRDLLHVFQRFDPKILSGAGKRRLKERLAIEFLAVAYFLREEEGAYLASATKYFECLFIGGWQPEAILGIAKLIPHKGLRIVKASQGRQASSGS